MCNITKRLKSSQVRSTRTAIRKKLQSSLEISFTKKLIRKIEKINSISSLADIDSPRSSTEDLKVPSEKFDVAAENEFYEKYEILQKIGEGGNSTVYKCQSKESNKIFAVKIMRIRDQELIQNFKAQFAINKSLSNSSIVQFEEFIFDQNSMTSYAVQEYCQFKNLKEELFSRPNRRFPEHEVISVTKSILEALNFLHSKGVCHRDIKPQNILYDPSNGQIKLIDFDCSKQKKKTENSFEMWTKMGTLNYQAPQYFLTATYSEKVDLWALGVIAYELLTGKLPFYNLYSRQTIKMIISSEIPFESLELSDYSKNLLKRLLQRQPNLRIDAQEAYKWCLSYKIQQN